MVTDNGTWLENLLENNGYSKQFLLIKVVNTVLKQNSFKSLLTWTNTSLSGFDNFKGIEDSCDKQDDLFFLNSISKLFDGSYGKYDLIIIESEKLFLDEEIIEQKYDEVLTKIINNHLTKEGKLLIIDNDNLISHRESEIIYYEERKMVCNDFRLDHSNKLEASIAIDKTNSILILSKNESSKTLLYNFEILNSVKHFDSIYCDKSLQFWIDFSLSFSCFTDRDHVKWDLTSLLIDHLNEFNNNFYDSTQRTIELNSRELYPWEKQHEIDNLINEFWQVLESFNVDVCFENDSNHIQLTDLLLPRNELTIFTKLFHDLTSVKAAAEVETYTSASSSIRTKNILCSYLIKESDYFFNAVFSPDTVFAAWERKKYWIPKNIFFKFRSKSNKNDFDFSSSFFDYYILISNNHNLSFVKESDFSDTLAQTISKSNESFNLIAIDYINDFNIHSEEILTELFISLFSSKIIAGADVFILVNKNVLNSTNYENFRMEFCHYLYSIIQIGNDYMIWFKNEDIKQVFISLDNLIDTRLLKLRIDKKSNFLYKKDDFYKSWLDTNHLFKTTNKGNSEAIKLLKDIKEDTKYIPEIKSDTGQILANTESMMSEIQKIKSLTEDTKESIDNSISLILESVEKNNDFNDIDKYIDKVTQWFNYWDKVEDNTKIFMPGSELLYYNIKNSGFEDFSPFVLYYCRALENELLNKIFLKFHTYFNDLSAEKQKALLNWDKEGLTENDLRKYKQTLDGLNSNIKNNKHTLGSMRIILNIIPNAKKKNGSKRYQRSPLLKEFYSFIKKEFGGFDPETVKQLENIITNYRNKSAHVEIINEENALVFYEDFKVLMNKLIEKL